MSCDDQIITLFLDTVGIFVRNQRSSRVWCLNRQCAICSLLLLEQLENVALNLYVCNETDAILPRNALLGISKIQKAKYRKLLKTMPLEGRVSSQSSVYDLLLDVS